MSVPKTFPRKGWWVASPRTTPPRLAGRLADSPLPDSSVGLTFPLDDGEFCRFEYRLLLCKERGKTFHPRGGSLFSLRILWCAGNVIQGTQSGRIVPHLTPCATFRRMLAPGEIWR